jgi:hypothetical protein
VLSTGTEAENLNYYEINIKIYEVKNLSIVEITLFLVPLTAAYKTRLVLQ